ncbi:MAG: TonB-dependent receptor [Desulfobacterales bacterium]
MNWMKIQAYGHLTERAANSDFSPQIGIKYSPLQWLSFKTNLAKYVRYPSFFELFGDRDFSRQCGTEEKEGINFDIGLQIRQKWNRNWLQSLSFGIAYFRNDADDLIARVYDSRGIGKSVNISGALIQGMESSATVDIHEWLRLIGQCHMAGYGKSGSIKAFDGKDLPGRFEKILCMGWSPVQEHKTVCGISQRRGYVL